MARHPAGVGQRDVSVVLARLISKPKASRVRDGVLGLAHERHVIGQEVDVLGPGGQDVEPARALRAVLDRAGELGVRAPEPRSLFTADMSGTSFGRWTACVNVRRRNGVSIVLAVEHGCLQRGRAPAPASSARWPGARGAPWKDR